MRGVERIVGRRVGRGAAERGDPVSGDRIVRRFGPERGAGGILEEEDPGRFVRADEDVDEAAGGNRGFFDAGKERGRPDAGRVRKRNPPGVVRERRVRVRQKDADAGNLRFLQALRHFPRRRNRGIGECENGNEHEGGREDGCGSHERKYTPDHGLLHTEEAPRRPPAAERRSRDFRLPRFLGSSRILCASARSAAGSSAAAAAARSAVSAALRAVVSSAESVAEAVAEGRGERGGEEEENDDFGGIHGWNRRGGKGKKGIPRPARGGAGEFAWEDATTWSSASAGPRARSPRGRRPRRRRYRSRTADRRTGPCRAGT